MACVKHLIYIQNVQHLKRLYSQLKLVTYTLQALEQV